MSRLLSSVAFDEVDETNVSELEKINLAIFPIKYPPRVYQDIVKCAGVSFLATIDDAPGLRGSKGSTGPTGPTGSTLSSTRTIGGVSCRLEQTSEGIILYIITLGVLAPYRNEGLGKALLGRSLETVRESLPEVGRARLHVQVSNTDAIRFYEKHGFEIVETIENYYLKTEPRHAVVLELKFHG